MTIPNFEVYMTEQLYTRANNLKNLAYLIQIENCLTRNPTNNSIEINHDLLKKVFSPGLKEFISSVTFNENTNLPQLNAQTKNNLREFVNSINQPIKSVVAHNRSTLFQEHRKTPPAPTVEKIPGPKPKL